MSTIQGKNFTGVIIDEIQGMRTTPMNPWEYLEHWADSDKPKAHNTLEYINQIMQERYPGDYKIVMKQNPKHFWEPWVTFKFDTPTCETYFRLKYL